MGKKRLFQSDLKKLSFPRKFDQKVNFKRDLNKERPFTGNLNNFGYMVKKRLFQSNLRQTSFYSKC